LAWYGYRKQQSSSNKPKHNDGGTRKMQYSKEQKGRPQNLYTTADVVFQGTLAYIDAYALQKLQSTPGSSGEDQPYTSFPLQQCFIQSSAHCEAWPITSSCHCLKSIETRCWTFAAGEGSSGLFPAHTERCSCAGDGANCGVELGYYRCWR